MWMLEQNRKSQVPSGALAPPSRALDLSPPPGEETGPGGRRRAVSPATPARAARLRVWAHATVGRDTRRALGSSFCRRAPLGLGQAVPALAGLGRLTPVAARRSGRAVPELAADEPRLGGPMPFPRTPPRAAAPSPGVPAARAPPRRRLLGPGPCPCAPPAGPLPAPAPRPALPVSLLNERHRYDDVEYEEEAPAVDEGLVRKCTEWLRGVEKAAAARDHAGPPDTLPHLSTL
ncbi:proline-rich protein 18 [Mirounga leonina]|uniref:proline-rich protein 18 n=1 Tax=Mirounga leonina TaxID=9715 RepID=UPI00156C114B|nr:proline-rich protein 18 [Mirounga leonina]